MDNEWSFVGEGNDFREQEVAEFIESFFAESDVYIVKDRHNSFLISLSEAPKKVKELLKDKDVILCDLSFKKMIEFNYIGVARHGEIK